jgi:protein O-mannosyl-transferase
MRRLPAHLSLLLAVLATWTASLHDGFVNFDTPWMVVDNRLLEGGVLSAVRAVLWDMSFATRHTLGAEYLPVRDLSVLMDLSLWPTGYFEQHMHNLVLYGVLCVLVLELMIAVLGQEPRAWFAAALFALHPIQTETVAWLVGRKDLLAGVFVVAGILLWLRSNGRGRGLALSIGCMLLACWSKNTAVVFPALLALFVVFGLAGQRDRRWWLGWLPLLGVVALVSLTSLAVGQQMGFLAERRGEGLLELLWVQCWILSHYLFSFLWPFELSALYPEPDLPLAFGLGELKPVVLCAALCVALAGSWRRLPLVAFGLSWFVVAQLPTSQLVPLQNVVADRYLFLPSLGLALAFGALMPVRNSSAQKVLVGLAVLLLFFLAGQSRERCQVWHDSVELWGDVVLKSPELGRGHAALAGALRAAGEAGQASTVIEQGLKRLPGDPLLLQARGLDLMRKGRAGEAEAALRGALRADSRLRRAANNLALLLHREKRSDEALELARQMTRTHPSYSHGLNTLGTILFDMSDLDGAERALLSSLQYKPDNTLAVCNLGSVMYRKKRFDQAASWWTRCLLLEPDNPTALEGLTHIEAR